jgi:hypothetical protein
MTYSLSRLAPGSYDVLLNGEIIASLVKNGNDTAHRTAEFLSDLPPEKRPAPFLEIEHEFANLGEAKRWLGLGMRSPPLARRPRWCRQSPVQHFRLHRWRRWQPAEARH